MSLHLEEDEFKRKRRVADMLVTAHSVLALRYRRISILFDVTIMISSFLVLLLSIVESAAPKILSSYMYGYSQVVIAVGASMIFVLSVIEWRVSWKGMAEAHSRAANDYSSVKGQIGGLLSRGFEPGDVEAARIADRYDQIGNGNVPIPNDKFVSLKRAHLRKVELSRLLDDQPFAVAMVMRLRLALKHTMKGWKNAR